MGEQTVKLGVVGLKRGLAIVSEVIGEKHVKLTAICDKDPDTLQQAREQLKQMGEEDLECFESYSAMLDSDIDAVVIASYAINHVALAVQALEAGKHVLSEIPVINSLEEARELKAAARAHPELKYMAGENCCYWAFIEAWKKMYEEGSLGQAVYAESEYLHGRDWRDMKPEDYPKDHWRSFNPAIKYLTHNLGPLLYILDDHCVSVSCMVPDTVYNPYRQQQNGVAIFKTAKGAVIRILICFDAFVGYDHNFRIIGTRGTLETDNTKPLDEAHSFARLSNIPGSMEEKIDIPVTLKFHGEYDGGHGGAERKMMRAFIKCIVENTKPPIDVDLGIQLSLPGIIAHESSVQGGALLEIPEIE